MYPLGTDKPWPVNQWYIAGTSAELTDKPLGRKLLGRSVVMFRDSQGKAVALSGICPHRMMPLEHGKVENDTLVCAYHALAFDVDGKCVSAPTAAASVPNCALDVFPLVEAAPLLWIWMGDPAKAATTPLPDQQSIGIGNPDFFCDIPMYEVSSGRYMLLIDNLFDLSHVNYVHANTIGDIGPVTKQDIVMTEREGRLTVLRQIENVPNNHFTQMLFPQSGERMSSRFETELVGISLINTVHTTWDGAKADGPHLGALHFIHGLTPQDEHSTHYWFIVTRDFRTDDAELSAGMSSRSVAAAYEDIEVMGQIEERLKSGEVLPQEISMKSDAGALRARLRVIQMIRSEA